jgi:hypothetical protein
VSPLERSAELCEPILSKKLTQNIQKSHISAGRVAQVVECLPSKCEALRSSPNTAKKKKKKKTKKLTWVKDAFKTKHRPIGFNLTEYKSSLM